MSANDACGRVEILDSIVEVPELLANAQAERAACARGYKAKRRLKLTMVRVGGERRRWHWPRRADARGRSLCRPVLEALMNRRPDRPPLGWPHARAKRWARRSARRKARRVLRETVLSLRASLADGAGRSSIPGGASCPSSL
jgi:hypothetical protein